MPLSRRCRGFVLLSLLQNVLAQSSLAQGSLAQSSQVEVSLVEVRRAQKSFLVPCWTLRRKWPGLAVVHLRRSCRLRRHRAKGQAMWAKAALRGAMFALPVAAGVGIFMLAVGNRQPPSQAPVAERAVPVRVASVAPQTFTPRVVGYGTAEPARTWSAVAQVAGRVAFVEPRLRVGAILQAGTEIIRIAPEDYEIAVKQAEANLRSAEAKLAELKVQETNAKASRDIEQASLELNEADVARKSTLVRRGAVSKSTLDDAERSLLTQRARVQDLENQIRQLPLQIDAQERQIEVNTAELEAAQFNLERTRIRLPFTARVASVDVETTQFVGSGSVMATADDVSSTEVNAQIPQERFATFVNLATPEGFVVTGGSTGNAQDIFKRLGWSATVSLRYDDRNATWDASVLRTSDTIDPKTRTVGAIVAVADPYKDIRPGVRPPLIKGMFVEVTIEGRDLEQRIVVPRSAVHAGRVFLADQDDRLRIRPVKIEAVQGSRALIASGIAAGDRIVLSDLAPAIEGQLLEPRNDNGDAPRQVSLPAAGQDAGVTTAAADAEQPTPTGRAAGADAGAAQ